jgi:hypothetical protein
VPPNKALHLTAIPLRSIAAGELYRSLMKMKPLTKNGFKKRLEISRRRSEDLHGQIGIISSGFSWLESRLIDMLSQCVNDIKLGVKSTIDSWEETLKVNRRLDPRI